MWEYEAGRVGWVWVSILSSFPLFEMFTSGTTVYVLKWLKTPYETLVLAPALLFLFVSTAQLVSLLHKVARLPGHAFIAHTVTSLAGLAWIATVGCVAYCAHCVCPYYGALGVCILTWYRLSVCVQHTPEKKEEAVTTSSVLALPQPPALATPRSATPVAMMPVPAAPEDGPPPGPPPANNPYQQNRADPKKPRYATLENPGPPATPTPPKAPTAQQKSTPKPSTTPGVRLSHIVHSVNRSLTLYLVVFVQVLLLTVPTGLVVHHDLALRAYHRDLARSMSMVVMTASPIYPATTAAYARAYAKNPSTLTQPGVLIAERDADERLCHGHNPDSSAKRTQELMGKCLETPTQKYDHDPIFWAHVGHDYVEPDDGGGRKAQLECMVAQSCYRHQIRRRLDKTHPRSVFVVSRMATWPDVTQWVRWPKRGWVTNAILNDVCAAVRRRNRATSARTEAEGASFVASALKKFGIPDFAAVMRDIEAWLCVV